MKKHRIKKVEPIFVELMPPFDEIVGGKLWISMKYRTATMRCPCGCKHLVVISFHPKRWSLCYDGKTITLKGSIWSATSKCGSHYFIINNMIRHAEHIPSTRISEYQELEKNKMSQWRREKQEAVPKILPIRLWERLKKWGKG